MKGAAPQLPVQTNDAARTDSMGTLRARAWVSREEGPSAPPAAKGRIWALPRVGAHARDGLKSLRRIHAIGS